MSVLDLSQQHLYRFFFDVMKPQHGDNIRMITADTDSFVFHTRADDRDMIKWILADRTKTSMLCARNSEVFGSFKAEVDGKNNDRIFRTAPHTLCFILHGDET